MGAKVDTPVDTSFISTTQKLDFVKQSLQNVMNESYISNQHDDFTTLGKINDRLRRLKIMIFRNNQHQSIIKRNKSEFGRKTNRSPGSPQPIKLSVLAPSSSLADDPVNSINTSSLTEMRIEHAAMNVID